MGAWSAVCAPAPSEQKVRPNEHEQGEALAPPTTSTATTSKPLRPPREPQEWPQVPGGHHLPEWGTKHCRETHALLLP
eukprot:7249348-Pyramimonas_sp.AAC.1